MQTWRCTKCYEIPYVKGRSNFFNLLSFIFSERWNSWFITSQFWNFGQVNQYNIGEFQNFIKKFKINLSRFFNFWDFSNVYDHRGRIFKFQRKFKINFWNFGKVSSQAKLQIWKNSKSRKVDFLSIFEILKRGIMSKKFLNWVKSILVQMSRLIMGKFYQKIHNLYS